MELIASLVNPAIDGSTVAMVGLHAPNLLIGDSTMVPMSRGVECTLIGKPELVAVPVPTATNPDSNSPPALETRRIRVALKARRLLTITGEVSSAGVRGGWTCARVAFIDRTEEDEDDIDEEDETYPMPDAASRAVELAEAMVSPRTTGGPSLVEQWLALARGLEKSPGQIDRLLHDLAQDGDMPLPTHPSDLALWVGALINPLPGMGVALEIRPALLLASSAEERVNIALTALRQSIDHMSGTKRMW